MVEGNERVTIQELLEYADYKRGGKQKKEELKRVAQAISEAAQAFRTQLQMMSEGEGKIEGIQTTTVVVTAEQSCFKAIGERCLTDALRSNYDIFPLQVLTES